MGKITGIQVTMSASKQSPSREDWCQQAIDRGDVAELLRLADGYPCACKGAVDGEPKCFCKMNSLQVRNAVSLAALRRGKLVRTKSASAQRGDS